VKRADRSRARAHARTGVGDANLDPVGFETAQGHLPRETDLITEEVNPR